MPAGDPLYGSFWTGIIQTIFLRKFYPNMMFVGEDGPLKPQDEDLASLPPVGGSLARRTSVPER